MWLWKPHYYAHEHNFYNFPYAFGHLFSLGLYAHLSSDRPGASSPATTPCCGPPIKTTPLRWPPVSASTSPSRFLAGKPAGDRRQVERFEGL